MIRRYLDNREIPEPVWPRLLQATEGLSHSHMKEVAGRIRTEPIEETMEGLELVQRVQPQAINSPFPRGFIVFEASE